MLKSYMRPQCCKIPTEFVYDDSYGDLFETPFMTHLSAEEAEAASLPLPLAAAIFAMHPSPTPLASLL